MQLYRLKKKQKYCGYWRSERRSSDVADYIHRWRRLRNERVTMFHSRTQEWPSFVRNRTMHWPRIILYSIMNNFYSDYLSDNNNDNNFWRCSHGGNKNKKIYDIRRQSQNYSQYNETSNISVSLCLTPRLFCAIKVTLLIKYCKLSILVHFLVYATNFDNERNKILQIPGCIIILYDVKL